MGRVCIELIKQFFGRQGIRIMTNEQLLEGCRLNKEINRLKENIESINTQYGCVLIGQKQKSLGVYQTHEIRVDNALKDAIQKIWEDELEKLEKEFKEL